MKHHRDVEVSLNGMKLIGGHRHRRELKRMLVKRIYIRVHGEAVCEIAIASAVHVRKTRDTLTKIIPINSTALDFYSNTEYVAVCAYRALIGMLSARDQL